MLGGSLGALFIFMDSILIKASQAEQKTNTFFNMPSLNKIFQFQDWGENYIWHVQWYVLRGTECWTINLCSSISSFQLYDSVDDDLEASPHLFPGWLDLLLGQDEPVTSNDIFNCVKFNFISYSPVSLSSVVNENLVPKTPWGREGSQKYKKEIFIKW